MFAMNPRHLLHSRVVEIQGDSYACHAPPLSGERAAAPQPMRGQAVQAAFPLDPVFAGLKMRMLPLCLCRATQLRVLRVLEGRRLFEALRASLRRLWGTCSPGPDSRKRRALLCRVFLSSADGFDGGCVAERRVLLSSATRLYPSERRVP